jgi:hypothetical protein
VQGFKTAVQPIEGASDQLALLTKALDKRGVWPEAQMRSASHYVRAIRALVVKDTGTEVRLLPQLPELWRGRTIDVLGLPVANGTMSFGLRWHGHRPALLWEASLAPEAPFTLKIPGIDAGFETSDRQGETLLTDPGWGSAS